VAAELPCMMMQFE